MTVRLVRSAAVWTLALAVTASVGCAKRPATAVASAPAPQVSGAGGSPPQGAGTPRPERREAPPRAAEQPAPARGSATESRPAPRDFAAMKELRDVHFDFDRYDIRAQDNAVLETNARWLKANPTYLVLIEGHADERGTNEYNVALGERRAKAAMNGLVSHGVQASRITIVSYGEERPGCAEKNETCWSRNRRAHFLGKAG